MSSDGLSDAKRRVLEAYLRGDARPVPPGPERPEREESPSGPAPLSPGQRQVWLHGQIAEEPIYNEPITIHRRGTLDREVLARTIEEIVRRHEAWRTAITVEDGGPVQRVQPPFEVEIPFDDLRALPAERREEEAMALAAADARRPFDFSRPPLFRARLVRFSEDEHRLFLTLHHIIFDGVSIYRVFLPELAGIYEAFARGLPSPLPEPALPYRKYAREKAAEEPSDESLSYWRRELGGGIEPLDLPTDRARPSTPTFRGAMLPLSLSKSVTASIHAVSRRAGVTPYMTLLAVFEVILHRYSGQEEFLVGSVTAGRDRSELEDVMGFFLNTIVLKAPLSGDPTFAELLGRVRNSVLGAIAHDDVSFERLAREVEPRPSPERHPLFSVLFSLEPPMAPRASGWDLTQIDVQTGTTKFDLSLELDERPDGIVGRFIYNTDLFDGETIARLEKRWRTLLGAALAEPDRRISEVAWFDPADEPALAALGAEPAVALPPVPEAFALQARRTPEAPAVREAGRVTSYGTLDSRVEAIARALRERGVGGESRVGVCLPRSTDLIAALLAVGRAGGAYVALDPEWPDARLSAVAADAEPLIVIAEGTAEAGTGGSVGGGVTVAELESRGKTIPPGAAPPTRPEDLAYVLYTSGSTGEPKGVMIEHRSVSNFLSWSQREFPLGAGDRVIQKAPVVFDASVWEIFAPLVAGAELVLAPPGFERDVAEFAACIRDASVTHLKLVPSLLGMLLATPEFRACRSLRHVFSGAEALGPELARDFFLRQTAALHNLYGPTETCVDVAWHRCEPGEDSGRIPIGRPLDNTRLYVVDRCGRLLPSDVPGELHVGGVPVGRGYWRREDLTREKFVADPYFAGGRLYKTGDRVRRRADGEIEFLGRLDHQIKVRGFRVEPREIEGALEDDPAVRSAVVVARTLPGSSAPSLVAYVEAPAASGEGDDLARSLRQRVSGRLPRSMVPDAIVVLPALPRTRAGKIDRGALPAPARGEQADRAVSAPESPEQALLCRIWCEVLGLPSVGIHDNLFDLGGNSLLVFQIAARASKAGYPVRARQLFEHSTIAELTAEVGTVPAMYPGMTGQTK